LAREFECDYIQIDSVVGHVKPRDEYSLQAFFDLMRKEYDGYVLGGVRFKYQPVLSEKSLKEDLEIAKKRCDAVCVTQDRTGEETSLERIIEFKKELNDFPLIVAAGVTKDNAKKQLKYADGAIIGSYFKDNYQDNGELCLEHIEELLKTVREIRGETK
ncbi:MAG TPA: BtpA/SgcQ family protein, partial [Erysipelotrichaceae bacterium]|nr:BtpA/SgcQ family protein [Erysipelotrichaceae bacterium]